MKHAWIENGSVRDYITTEPAETFTPQIAAFYNTVIPDDIERGATLVNDVWTNPVPPEPQPVVIEGEATVVVDQPV